MLSNFTVTFSYATLFSFGVFALSKLKSIVSSIMTSRRSRTFSFFQDIPRDFWGEFCFADFVVVILNKESGHTLKDSADQRDEGSSHKGWFSSVKRLHYTFHLSQTKICGTRTNFTRALTTFSEGPSTDKIWYGKIIYTKKFTGAQPFFGVCLPFLSEPCQKFSVV